MEKEEDFYIFNRYEKIVKWLLGWAEQREKPSLIITLTLLPFLVKKSLEYLPLIMSLRGTLPRSSMIRAIWSMWQAVARGERKTDKTHNRFIRQCPSHRPTLGVEGWGWERTDRQHTHLGPIAVVFWGTDLKVWSNMATRYYKGA